MLQEFFIWLFDFCLLYQRKQFLSIRDRSFFMSMGGLVGFGGGPREKKWH